MGDATRPDKLWQVLARDRRPDVPVGCLVLSFAIFPVAGLAVAWVLAVSPVLRSLEARNWKETPCTIISSSVRPEGGRGGSWSVDIKYRYEFDGVEFVADRHGFFQKSSSDRSSMDLIVARFPAGRGCACWVDPRDPREAVLERGITGDVWPGILAPLLLFLFGAGGIYWALVVRKKGLTSGLTVAATVPSIDMKVAVNPDGTITLAPGMSGIAKVVSSGVMAIVMNAAAAFAVILVRAKGMDWIGAIFSTLVVLVGASTVVKPIKAVLELFNPRVIVTIGTGVLRLGSVVPLSWRVEGRSAPRRLLMKLVGREVATFAGGKGTVNKEERFHESVLLDVGDPAGIVRGGRLELKIPPGSMHTFEAKQYKIEWLITVTGEIPRWPDMKEEYPLNVRPAEVVHG
jgi:hypothetical protein